MQSDEAIIYYVEKFFDYDPITATRTLEAMPDEQAIEILNVLPTSICVSIFKRLQVNHAAALLEQVPEETYKKIIENLEPKQGASIVIHFTDDLREKLISRLDEKKRSEIREFLKYPKGSVGSLMTTHFVAFNSSLKIKDAKEQIRKRANSNQPPSSYVYVTDDNQRLIGVLNMRDLVIGDENDTLDSIMIKNIFTLNAFTDRNEAANELSTRRYFAAPVVDRDNHLLGIVKADQLLGEAQDRASSDVQKMFGVSPDENAFSTLKFSLVKRLPWLHVNLVTAFMAGAVIAVFEGIIAKITVLAIFLPIIAGQGGNAGSQSLAVVMRGLVMREISPNETKRLVIKEMKLGFINGLVIGLVTAVIAWLWKGNPYLGLVIGLAMIVNLVAAGLSGAAIPNLLKKFGFDPAQSSAIILTTVTDIIGFFAFLGFAMIFQDLLV